MVSSGTELPFAQPAKTKTLSVTAIAVPALPKGERWERRRLDDLEQDYAMLRMQSQELAVRNVKGQMTMPMAA